MLDNLTITKQLPSNLLKREGLVLKLGQIEFYQDPRKPKGLSFIASTESINENGLNPLDLKIRAENGSDLTLTMTGSVHKSATNGYNHTQFPFSALQNELDRLDDLIPSGILDGKITRLESAVNLENTHPETLFGNWSSLKNKTFDRVLANGKEVGRKFFFSEHDVKGYDKGAVMLKQDGLNTDKRIARFELVHKRQRYIHQQTPIQTVRDLVDRGNLERLGQNLVKKHQEILMIPNLSFEEMTAKDMELWLIFSNDPRKLNNLLKKYSPSTRKRKKAAYKALLKKYGKLNDGKAEINRLISETWNTLLES